MGSQILPPEFVFIENTVWGSKPITILGIDPSLSSTGIGVVEVEGGKWKASFWEVVRPPKDECLSRRLFFLYQRLSEILAIHTPDIVAVEEVFLARDPKAAILLGEAKGAILAAVGAYLKDFSVGNRTYQSDNSSLSEVWVKSPNHSDMKTLHQFSSKIVKRAVVGNGSASKEQVRYMVKKLLNINDIYLPQDASDALAVAICGALTVSYL